MRSKDRAMDPETLKLVGNASAQLILAAGYFPAWRLFKLLWEERQEFSKERGDFIDRLLKLTADTIEAEKDMTQALNILAEKISK